MKGHRLKQTNKNTSPYQTNYETMTMTMATNKSEQETAWKNKPFRRLVTCQLLIFNTFSNKEAGWKTKGNLQAPVLGPGQRSALSQSVHQEGEKQHMACVVTFCMWFSFDQLLQQLCDGTHHLN